jgi:hypothetical protein
MARSSLKFAQFIVLFACCLCVSSCAFYYGPREQVKAFANDKDDLILAISKKVEAAPTLAGVAEAQKLVDAKKDSLKAQRQAIEDARPGMNSDWRSTLSRSQSNDAEMLLMISVKLSTACKESCPDVDKKFREVKDAFLKATKLPGEI